MMTPTIARCARVLPLLAALALVGPAPAGATTRLVTDPGDSNQPGQLRTLIDQAVPGDVIVIPAGTFTLTEAAGGSLLVAKTLTFQGAGADRTILVGTGTSRVLDVGVAPTVAVSGVTIRSGRERTAGASGGGIRNFGTLTLTSVLLAGNSAGGNGGGIHNEGTLTLSSVTLHDNTAETAGGGLVNGADGSVTLVNTTVSGNHAQLGGGLHSVGALGMNNVTIAGNQGSVGGGGLFSGGTTRLRNTIIAGNTGGSGPDCFVAPATVLTSEGSNLVQNATGCTGLSVNDLTGVPADLAPLALSGGQTPTHAVLPGGQPLDRGDGACAATDQRGVPRPQNGRCDIGAVEARPPGILVSTGTGPGGAPHVKLYRVDGAGTPTALGGGFFAYNAGFVGGVQATLAAVGSDLFVVTGVGSGGGPHVKLFRVTDLATGAVSEVGPGFLAYDPGFTGGARVAATTDDTGRLVLVTGVGPGGGAHVRVFVVTDLATGAVAALGGGFIAYDPGFTGGVNVGAR
jgi:hypothetical protein